MEYHQTLNLPKTDFPMKAQLPKREPEMLKHWEEIDIYNLVREKRKGSPLFVLHDGPPFANGAIHMGTALNKVLKDMVIKYNTMKGMNTPYVPGWDTHGLPIEHQIIKTKKIRRHEIPPLEFRGLCRDYAMNFVGIQKEQFYRLGVRGDWDNPYLTLHPSFEARQIEVFGVMAKKGFIYKGLKPVYWCPVCETALAEAEIEYDMHESPSIFVKFPVVDRGGKLPEKVKECYFLIWTTTPWTIPANLAVAVHPSFTYVLAKVGEDHYLLAEGLMESVRNEIGGGEWVIIEKYKGSELDKIVCKHPIIDRNSLVVLSDFVTLEQGTGCVHIAPGHGLEDYYVGQKYGLDVLSPVDNRGIFTDEAGPFSGLHYKKGNDAVIEALNSEGRLLKSSMVDHQYPHCWRCKKPVMFRATEQWFASVDGFRRDAIEAIRDVKWYPKWGEERIFNMVNERQDWCISRQRIWGVPIPAFYCEDCGEILLSKDSIESVRQLFSKEGSDAWFKYEAGEILPDNISCSGCSGTRFSKETDTMDVWFDSGSSHMAVCEDHPHLHWPADLYLEGSDQYRGWFQSSLLTSVAMQGTAPYRAVVSHGWVVDGEGKKMSKSLGNVISPEEIIKDYGADLLRLWVSSADFTKDVHISPGILKQLAEVYRKIRNTSRFLLANLYDFNPEQDFAPYEDMQELDCWALARLQLLIKKVTEAYEKFEFHQVFHAVHNFCVVDMSNFYLNINKDRLYCELPDSNNRRAIQTVMLEVLKTISMLVAPILTFTSDEIWRYIPGSIEESVQLTDWPEVNEKLIDQDLLKRWSNLLELRNHVSRALETARNQKEIKDGLEAEVIVMADAEFFEKIEPYRESLSELLVVSACRLELFNGDAPEGSLKAEGLPLYVKVFKSSASKCPRCWKYEETVGEGNDETCSRCSGVIQKLDIQ